MADSNRVLEGQRGEGRSAAKEAGVGRQSKGAAARGATGESNPSLPADKQQAKQELQKESEAGDINSGTKGNVPGKPVELSTKVLDTGRDLLQSFAPLRGIHEHVCGFHFYAHDMSRQVEAHHYCSHPSEEVRQCVIFESDQPGARLIGVEYIISRRLFETLPEEEKCLWHSHAYEVSSGELIAPRVPGMAERQDMQKLTDTYGKTWHTWQIDRGDPLPYGPPQLMMAFTADGQLNPQMWADRDWRYGVNSAAKREERASLKYPDTISPGADSWKSGEAKQVEVRVVPFKPASFPPQQEPAAKSGPPRKEP